MRVCFLLKIKVEKAEDYRKRHAEVWPEMEQALRETGWHNYSLFLADDGLLVGYLETDDLQQSLSEMAAQDVNTRWQREMAEYFADLNGRRPDEGFLQLEQVFHLD